MHLAMCLGAALALAGPAAAQPVTTHLETVPGYAEVDRTTTTQDIAFRDDRFDRMTVPVRLSGRGPYRFLVDTGADRTAVSTAIAAQLKLVEGPKATLHSISGISSVRTASVPHLQLGGDRVRSVEAPLLDAGNMGADGILGVDALRAQRVVFDFRSRTLSIVPSEQSLAREERGTIVVRGRLRKGHLIVTTATAENMPATLVLDTGAEMTIGNEALRQRLAARPRLLAPEPVVLLSVTGQKLFGNIYHIRELRIGEVTLHDLAIVFANAQTFRALDLERQPSLLLGMNAMRAFDKVSIDFARKKLRVLVPEHSSRDGVRIAAR